MTAGEMAMDASVFKFGELNDEMHQLIKQDAKAFKEELKQILQELDPEPTKTKSSIILPNQNESPNWKNQDHS